MKKLLVMAAPLALAAGFCGLLKADDSGATPTAPTNWDATNSYLWAVEHTAEVAKDPDASGIQAVMAAEELLKDREPQVQTDFFNKALYDTKNRAVQREIRMVLFRIYRNEGQTDKATEQLQLLMSDE
jgi:hypothetical protein